MAWTEIHPSNWLRLIATIYFTSFAPGYCVLRISKGLKYLGRLSTFLLSYLLSLFITCLLGFALLISHHSIQDFGPTFLALANISLAIIATVRYRKRCACVKITKIQISVNLYDIVVILITLGIVIGAIKINMSNSFFLFGAQNVQLNQGIAHLKEIPVGLQGAPIGYYDYWFFIYLANYISFSGFPIVNAYLILLLFTCMPTLAFYEMIKKLTKSVILAVIATIMMSFQGFGWIYARYLRLTNASHSILHIFWTLCTGTYEFRNAVVWLPNIVHPIFLVTFPIFCILVYQAFENNLPKWTKYLFISPLVALGYLSHHYEVVFFIIIYSLISLLGQIIKIYNHDLNTTLSIIVGLALVSLIDVLSPVKWYVMKPNILPLGSLFYISKMYILSIALILFPLAMYILHRCTFFAKLNYHKILNIIKIRSIFSKYILRMILCTILGLIYFILFMVWLNINQEIEVGEYLFVPIYSYPIRFGVNCIMSLFTLMLIILGYPLIKRDSERRFFKLMSIMFLVAFTLGRISNFFGLGFESRLHTFLLMSLATSSALTIRFLFSLRMHARKLSVGLVIIVFLLGAMSSITYMKFWSLVTTSQQGVVKISKNEIKALDFLRSVTTPSDYVLSVSTKSITFLTTLTGLKNELYYPRYIGESVSKTFWTSSTPEVLGYLFNKTNVKYIYLAKRDADMLNHFSDYLLYNLLGFFPVIYFNQDVKIIQVPSLSPSFFKKENFLIDQAYEQCENMSSIFEFDKLTQTFSHTSGKITLEGNITIKSLRLKQISGELLFISGSNKNAINKLIGNGRVNVTIQCGKATIDLSNLGNLIQININSPSNVFVILTHKSELISNFSESQSITLKNGPYLFKHYYNLQKGLKIILERPEILVHGNVTFNSAYFWPYEPRSWGEDLIVAGVSNFSIIFSDTSLLIVDVEGIKGKVEIYSIPEYAGQRDELTDIYNFISSLLG